MDKLTTIKKLIEERDFLKKTMDCAKNARNSNMATMTMDAPPEFSTGISHAISLSKYYKPRVHAKIIDACADVAYSIADTRYVEVCTQLAELCNMTEDEVRNAK